MKPICVKCRLFFKPKKNGVAFEEGMPKRGVAEPREEWGPYKLWIGDLYECRGCLAQVIVGVASAPIAEHFQVDYAEKVSRFQPMLRVDDC